MDFNLSLVVLGGLVLGLGLVSNLLQERFGSDRLLALACGVLLGPAVLDVLDPEAWASTDLLFEEAARLTLGIGLMGVALRLPSGYRGHWRSVGVLLVAGMLGMWAVSSALVWAIAGVPLWVALLVGAVVTPTDPVVGSAVVTGSLAERNLPARLRHLISAESGMNDGLAYPLVLLPVLVLTQPDAAAWATWATRVLLWEVGAALGLGLAIGWAAGKALEWAEAHDLIERPSYLAFTLALALFTLGAVKLLGSDGILAVFAAGLALDTVVTTDERRAEERIAEAFDRFFSLPIFALFGMALPWAAWAEMGWRAVALAGAVLLLRRLPVVLALAPWVRPLQFRRDALFAGWFGPVGVAALFYASFALRETGVEEVWTLGSLLVAASVLVHGGTSTVFTRLYGRHDPDAPYAPEDDDADASGGPEA